MNEILYNTQNPFYVNRVLKQNINLLNMDSFNEFDLAESIIKSIEIANNIDDCQSNQLICHKRQNNFKQKYIELVNQLLL